MADFVISSLEAGVPHLRLNRPDKRNAIHSELSNQFVDGMEGFAADGHTFGVITAAGPIFCAGADVTDPGVGGVHPSTRLLDALSSTTMLWLAVVDKPVLGVGLSLIARCPVVLCSHASTFSLPEWRLGLFPSPVVADLIPVLGPRRAFTAALTGEPMTAAEAVDAGLATEAVPPSDLASRTSAWIELLAGRTALLGPAVDAWRAGGVPPQAGAGGRGLTTPTPFN